HTWGLIQSQLPKSFPQRANRGPGVTPRMEAVRDPPAWCNAGNGGAIIPSPFRHRTELWRVSQRSCRRGTLQGLTVCGDESCEWIVRTGPQRCVRMGLPLLTCDCLA